MSKLTKQVNEFFSIATKQEIEELLDKIILDEYQAKIIRLRYIQHKDIGLIADILNISRSTVNNELTKIRKKLSRAMGTRDI